MTLCWDSLYRTYEGLKHENGALIEVSDAIPSLYRTYEGLKQRFFRNLIESAISLYRTYEGLKQERPKHLEV